MTERSFKPFKIAACNFCSQKFHVNNVGACERCWDVGLVIRADVRELELAIMRLGQLVTRYVDASMDEWRKMCAPPQERK